MKKKLFSIVFPLAIMKLRPKTRILRIFEYIQYSLPFVGPAPPPPEGGSYCGTPAAVE